MRNHLIQERHAILHYNISNTIHPIEATSEIKKQLSSFSKSATTITFGMTIGYIVANSINHAAIGAAAGTAGAILADHYLRDGKDDPRVARKIGYVIPVIVGGVSRFR